MTLQMTQPSYTSMSTKFPRDRSIYFIINKCLKTHTKKLLSSNPCYLMGYREIRWKNSIAIRPRTLAWYQNIFWCFWRKLSWAQFMLSKQFRRKRSLSTVNCTFSILEVVRTQLFNWQGDILYGLNFFMLTTSTNIFFITLGPYLPRHSGWQKLQNTWTQHPISRVKTKRRAHYSFLWRNHVE